MFEVGDKIKCVNAEWPGRGRQFKCPLQLGAVYTVTGFESLFGIGIDGVARPSLCVKLAEVRNPAKSGSGFDVRRFRKLPEIKSGLERLRAIVDGSEPVEIDTPQEAGA